VGSIIQKTNLTRVAVFCATDFILAILPMLFIFKIARPLHERILLSAMLSMGILASIAGVIRVVILSGHLPFEDSRTDLRPLMVATLEESLALIAVSMPVLRPLYDKMRGKSDSTKGTGVTSSSNISAGISGVETAGSWEDDRWAGSNVRMLNSHNLFKS